MCLRQSNPKPLCLFSQLCLFSVLGRVEENKNPAATSWDSKTIRPYFAKKETQGEASLTPPSFPADTSEKGPRGRFLDFVQYIFCGGNEFSMRKIVLIILREENKSPRHAWVRVFISVSRPVPQVALVVGSLSTHRTYVDHCPAHYRVEAHQVISCQWPRPVADQSYILNGSKTHSC